MTEIDRTAACHKGPGKGWRRTGLTRAERLSRWTRERICADCGKIEHVRKDNEGVRCAPCAKRRCGEKGAAFHRMKAEERRRNAKPKQLQLRLRAPRALKRVTRLCKQCKKLFVVPRSVLSGKTNASGNFCCRPCYNEWLCDTERTSGRGSRWASIRRSVLKKFPFCAWCGTRHHLQVHHLVPYRLTQNNAEDHLIPLCRACHKRIEHQTNEIISICKGENPERFLGPLAAMLRYRQRATARLLLKLFSETKKSHAA